MDKTEECGLSSIAGLGEMQPFWTMEVSLWYGKWGRVSSSAPAGTGLLIDLVPRLLCSLSPSPVFYVFLVIILYIYIEQNTCKSLSEHGGLWIIEGPHWNEPPFNRESFQFWKWWSVLHFLCPCMMTNSWLHYWRKLCIPYWAVLFFPSFRNEYINESISLGVII